MSYIGKAPGFGIRNRYYYTATSSQTLFSGADDNGQTLAYADSKYLDVYLNGVLLVAGTDYTATTLTSVSLTTGAAASDIVEIVAYDIFSVADTVSAANGGTFNGAVTFDAGLNTDTISEETSATGVTIDGVLLKDNDIEATDGTFSGGVYLGGTGAANYLDDYEEGTWTATVTTSNANATFNSDQTKTGSYTKIGNTVTFAVYVEPDVASVGTGHLRITGLPFTITGEFVAFSNAHDTLSGSTGQGYANQSSDWLVFTNANSTTSLPISGTGKKYAMLSGTYFTTA